MSRRKLPVTWFSFIASQLRHKDFPASQSRRGLNQLFTSNVVSAGKSKIFAVGPPRAVSRNEMTAA